ncbi:MAG: hypothetical protein OSA24_04160 [Longimicrobiales bacterium]|jgi:hypothetical protein|nr:hypothetical protein [Longimicrobiales bacterium]
MSLIPFYDLPDDSQLWIFGIEKDLGEPKEKLFIKELDHFLETWSAHGASMICGRELRYSRFLFVAVDMNSVPPSGCSIDGLIHFLKDQEVILNLKIVDNSPIFYRGDNRIQRVARSDFKKLSSSGSVSMDSTVFDNSIKNLSELRNGEWEKTVQRSWHKQFFS